MIRGPPIPTRTATLLHYTTLCRSQPNPVVPVQRRAGRPCPPGSNGAGAPPQEEDPHAFLAARYRRPVSRPVPARPVCRGGRRGGSPAGGARPARPQRPGPRQPEVLEIGRAHV